MRKSILAFVALIAVSLCANAQPDPLPSWNEGTAKKAIVDFVHDLPARLAAGEEVTA